MNEILWGAMGLSSIVIVCLLLYRRRTKLCSECGLPIDLSKGQVNHNGKYYDWGCYKRLFTA